MNLIMIKEYLS